VCLAPTIDVTTLGWLSSLIVASSRPTVFLKTLKTPTRNISGPAAGFITEPATPGRLITVDLNSFGLLLLAVLPLHLLLV
jgi:hypothetical protein